MHSSSRIIPLEKNVVLVGAGNAHLVFVKRFGMRPMPGVAVTLVSESGVIPYSAMVPGHLGGKYPRDAISLDLVRLCRSSGVRLIPKAAVRIDVVRREVHFADRPPVAYDVLSFAPGSMPACPPGMEHGSNSWKMRPLAELVDRLDSLEAELRRSPRAFHLVPVGGGVSGCELTLAIHRRFQAASGFRLTLLQSNASLLPGFPGRAGRLMMDRLVEAGVTVRLNARVTGGDGQSLVVNGDERLAFDAVLWATSAAPTDLARTLDLPCDEAGFLKVTDTLQSIAEPTVFGTGDTISIVTWPDQVRNGVHAVRQGNVLFDNIERFLHDRPLTRFHPQRWCLCLMNTSDDEAILSYGPFTTKGRLVRWLKDRIDRAWIDKFTLLPSMGATPGDEEEDYQMRCGGCGSKVAGDVLSAVLKRIDPGDDSRIVMGCKAGEDASVHRMRPELFGEDPNQLVEVQTVDHFKAFVDDPYLFGRIAAIHAVSDLHAMNARPFTALAIATLPYARGPVQEGMLYELLAGAVETLRSFGVTLTGGHTTEGAELALGFAVTGHGEEDRLFRKGALRVGDALVLTQPVGSGALLAAWMRSACRATWFAPMLAHMLRPSDRAAAVLARHDVKACTDVTGFGLAGHLLEMLDASAVSAEVDASRVPVYEGFAEVVGQGIVSTLQRDNARYGCRVDAATPPAWLFDPQTAGGLLFGVPESQVEAVVRELIEAGYTGTARIGRVVPVEAGGPRIGLGGG